MLSGPFGAWMTLRPDVAVQAGSNPGSVSERCNEVKRLAGPRGSSRARGAQTVTGTEISFFFAPREKPGNRSVTTGQKTTEPIQKSHRNRKEP